MAASDTAKLRHLAAIIQAELAIERATKRAFKAWLPQVADAILYGKVPAVQPLLAAVIDPSAAEQTRDSWAEEVAALLLLIGGIFDRQRKIGQEFSDAREAYLASVRARLLSIPDEIFVRLSRIVSDGTLEGLDQTKMAERVQGALDPTDDTYTQRAKAVGRTEGVSVYNAGRHQAYVDLARETGQQWSKTWLSVRDTRVRHTHRVADGQKVPLAAKFNVGGSFANYPGDPSLPAAEAINCRCVAIYAGSRSGGSGTPIVALTSESDSIASHGEALLAMQNDKTGLGVRSIKIREGWPGSMVSDLQEGSGTQGSKRPPGGENPGGPEGQVSRGSRKESEESPTALASKVRNDNGAMGSDAGLPGGSVQALSESGTKTLGRMADGPLSQNGQGAGDPVHALQPDCGISGERMGTPARREDQGAPMSTPEQIPNGWRGIMAPLGTPTGDGRQLNVPEGGVRTRPLPVTFDWAPSREGGHDGAVMAGRIDRVWVVEDGPVAMLWGEGAIDVGGYNGAEYARQLADGFAMFVSVDPDEVTFETQFFNADGEMVPFAEAVVTGVDGTETLKEGYIVRDVMTDWRLAGVTAVTIPAFQEARIEPVYGYVAPDFAGQARREKYGAMTFADLMVEMDFADGDELVELARTVRTRLVEMAEDDNDSIIAAVTGSTGYPVFAERKRKWDGHSARQNVAKWASSDGSGDPDKINKKRFQSAFLYMGEPNTGNSLDGEGFAEKKKATPTWNVEDAKGGFVDIIDGKPYIVANAVIGLAGGHGVQAMDVPGPAKKAMLGKLKTLYGKMKRVFPDFPTFPFNLSTENDTLTAWNQGYGESTAPIGRSFDGSTVATAGGAVPFTAGPAVRSGDASRVRGEMNNSSDGNPDKSNTPRPSGSTVEATARFVESGSQKRQPTTNSGSGSASTASNGKSSTASSSGGAGSVASNSPKNSVTDPATSTTITSPANSGACSVVATTSVSENSVTTQCSCGELSTTSNDDEAIVAAAGQVFHLPNFENPKFTAPTAPVVQGKKFFGHVALFDSCYMRQGGMAGCTKPPKGNDYSRFLAHGARLENGEILPVGLITFGEGHFAGGSLKASMANYANIATGAAKVNVGEDEFGVWVAGEVLDQFADRADDLLLAPLSGHWEPDLDRGGALTLIAAHVVVAQGFNVPRLVASVGDDGEVTMALIAGPFELETPETSEEFNGDVAAVVAAVRADRRAQYALRKLGLDTDSRASAALARLGVRQ